MEIGWEKKIYSLSKGKHRKNRTKNNPPIKMLRTKQLILGVTLKKYMLTIAKVKNNTLKKI